MSTRGFVRTGDQVLITGASGFLGGSVTENLLRRGFSRVRCMVRPSSNLTRLRQLEAGCPPGTIEIVAGNLLRREDCERAASGVVAVYHLAAGTGDKSYASAFLNSVVTTRNLLDALQTTTGTLRRFVSVSSMAVYSGTEIRPGALIDERSPLEAEPERRHEAYCYGKLKQDAILKEYGDRCGVPFVIIRPGVIYGPGKSALTGRVGVAPSKLFLHLGGPNILPMTYIDNCADAVVLAGFTQGIDGQTFNIVDDNLPTSRTLLRLYKANVRRFRSVYLPHLLGKALCVTWERYAAWSNGQLPPVYNRRAWGTYWQGNVYSNEKAKRALGWIPQVPTDVGLSRYFAYCRAVKDASC